MKFDSKYIAHALSVYGFRDGLPLDSIEYVPMHQFRVATKEKLLLYVDNLQCCVSLFASAANFGFAAHINTMVMRGDEFYVDGNGKPIKCKRVEDLFDSIISSKVEPSESIKIGISKGCIYPGDSYPTMDMVYDGIADTKRKLEVKGYSVDLLEQDAMHFVLDTSSGKMIFPQKNME